MKGYQSYFDKQVLSPAGHQRLLVLGETAAPRRAARWPKWCAAAACCALLIGVGLWRLDVSRTTATPPAPSVASVTPPASSTEDINVVAPVAPIDGFVAVGNAEDGQAPTAFYFIPGLDMPDLSSQPSIAADIALPDGSFSRSLSQEEISAVLFGGEERRQEALESNGSNVPWYLYWDGLTISGSAIYDGEGQLWQADIYGKDGEREVFSLALAPGKVPPTCIVREGGAVTDVLSTAVTSWLDIYDRDGDGEKETVRTSECVAHGVGMRFVSAFSEDSMCHEIFVWHVAAEPGLSLEPIAHCDDIPDWRNVHYDSLFQARESEPEFAPYLPKTAPVNWSEFNCWLGYQEDQYNYLWVDWYHGYDSVGIQVQRPEGEGNSHFQPVDINVPESYDWRLYDGCIADCVPEQYQLDFYSPTFRAEDMSREVIAARGNEKDTGGLSYHFSVLYPDGTVVLYNFSGMTEEQIWRVVEQTL